MKINKNLCLTTSTDRHPYVITTTPVVHSAGVSVHRTSNNIPTLVGLTAKVKLRSAARHESFCTSVVSAPHIATSCDDEDRLYVSAASSPAATRYPCTILNPDRPPYSKPLYRVDEQTILTS
jgi:hypothetical protein